MHTILGSFMHAHQAEKAIEDLEKAGVPSECLKLQVNPAAEGQDPLFGSTAAEVLVDVRSGQFTQDLIEGVLFRHQATKVFGASGDIPGMDEMPHIIPVSTGTYEIQKEHSMDIATDFIVESVPSQPAINEGSQEFSVDAVLAEGWPEKAD